MTFPSLPDTPSTPEFPTTTTPPGRCYGPVPTIVNGMLTFGDNTVGTFLYILCNPEHNIEGARAVTCLPNLQWSAPGRCVRAVTPTDPVGAGQCSEASVPPVWNGFIDRNAGNNQGDTRYVRCNTGFYLIGSPVVTCLQGGQWSAPGYCEQEPTTQRPGCFTPLPVVRNGTLVGNSYQVGAVWELKCDNKNFEIKGNSTVTCLPTNRWSKAGSCSRKPTTTVAAVMASAVDLHSSVASPAGALFFVGLVNYFHLFY